MADPLLFISHKHSDGKIAQVVAAFIEEKSNNAVRVHLSSNPDFQGPKFGKGLNAQLREALWNTDVLILIYTSADQDWQYCMWECGVATHPQSRDTNIIVFQCATEAPSPFQDVLRVNVRRYDDIKRFTDQFFRDAKFFPTLNGPFAPAVKDLHVENAAKDLFKKLAEVLPVDPGSAEEWRTWPYLRIELPRSEVDRIEQASEAERVKLSHQIVSSFAEVSASDPRAAQLFGQAVLPQKLKFENLLKSWKDRNREADASWFDSCCEQIMMGAVRGFPIIRWTPIREVGGESEFTPILSRVRRLPFAGRVEFDVYFYNLSDPRAVPVTSRMIPTGDFFCKELGKFNSSGHPLYIVHRSMIDKFIVKRVLSASGGSPADLTVADLLKDSEMKEIFENTFVVVKRQATIAEAKSAMISKPGCSDVFVTAEGTRNEPVQGWLTNVDITRSS
jgi:hypothetical protein